MNGRIMQLIQEFGDGRELVDLSSCDTDKIHVLMAVKGRGGPNYIFGYFSYDDSIVCSFFFDLVRNDITDITERVLRESHGEYMLDENLSPVLKFGDAFDVHTPDDWIFEHGTEIERNIRQFMNAMKEMNL